MKILSKSRKRVTLAVFGVATALGMAGNPAHAVEDTIDVDYDVNGVTRIVSTGSDITLGPAVMYSRVEATGPFTGDMSLPGTRTEFKLLGFLPVTANVAFEPTAPTTGTIARVGRVSNLASTSTYHVRLTNIKASIFPLFAGPFCRTKDPVVINANTPAGEAFSVANGGRLTGEYSIGDFQHCGLNTLLINSIIPGSGNTVELNLTNGRLH